jgi:hypothetical protein
MSTVVALPPRLIDHSFPRDERELRIVASALGEIGSLAGAGKLNILVTDTFKDLVESFDFNVNFAGPASEVHAWLSRLFLQGQSYIVECDCSNHRGAQIHPLPPGIVANAGMVAEWCAEMGGVLVWHDQFASAGEYYIGIACGMAFAGHPIEDYCSTGSQPGSGGRRFPIIGHPSSYTGSSSPVRCAKKFCLPNGYAGRPVTFANACRNVFRLGATAVTRPKNGSHYKVVFPGHRPWPLDKNDDPLPERYLRELTEITGYEYPVVRYTLSEGKLPERKFFFEA